MLVVFVGLVLLIGVIGGITLILFITKKRDKKELTPKEKNIKKIILVIGIILILIIGLVFTSRFLGLSFNLNIGGGNEQTAVCSNNSTTFIKLTGNSKKTYVVEEMHTNSSYLADSVCNSTLKIALYYDRKANVNCDNQDINAYYNRKEDINVVIDSYKQNNYKCFIYGNDLEENKNKIVGSWCGEDSLSRYKYTFNSDGTLLIEYDWKNYDYKSNNDIKYRNSKNGYYTYNNNKIITSELENSYQLIILEEMFKYVNETNTLKTGKDYMFTYNKCN